MDFSKTDSVTEVILMSNAVVTHFMNSGNNRYLSLDYIQNEGHLTATLPIDSVKLIPGFYMLMIMVDDIPSEGKIIHIKNEEVKDSKPIAFLDSTFVWTENHYYLNGSESFKYTIDAIPTTFSSRTYYEVLRTTEELSDDWVGTGDFIRQENKIIYLYQNPVDAELYNFNVLVNDSFQELPSGIQLIVTSIDTITLLTGENRKRWKFRCIYDDPQPIVYTEWIEGIGNINGLFATSSMSDCVADADGSIIMCMFRNDTLIYDNPDVDGCWLLPVATKETKEESIYLAPNPTSESITIMGLENEIKTVTVFNAVGKQVYRGTESRIDLKAFPPGYYYTGIVLKDNLHVIKGFIKL